VLSVELSSTNNKDQFLQGSPLLIMLDRHASMFFDSLYAGTITVREVSLYFCLSCLSFGNLGAPLNNFLRLAIRNIRPRLELPEKIISSKKVVDKIVNK